MSKKEVYIHLNPNIPPPYDGWIRERNGNVARCIGEHLGARYAEETPTARVQERYCVPSKALPMSLARELGIKSVDDLFGGVVESPIHSHKSILHPTPNGNVVSPSCYSPRFAQAVRKATLPGYTTFSSSEAVQALNLLSHQGHRVRFKEPDNSDCDGQKMVQSEEELRNELARYTHESIQQKGIVLEANLSDAVTTSVGTIFLKGQQYVHLARQVSVFHKGRWKYGGADITVYKGGWETFKRFPLAPNLQLAVDQSQAMFNAFGELDPVLSRASFDVVQGYGANGEFLSGVTDTTFRLGGSTPAEILAIQQLTDNPSLRSAQAQVRLHYNPQNPSSYKGVIFLNHPDLIIEAKLV